MVIIIVTVETRDGDQILPLRPFPSLGRNSWSGAYSDLEQGFPRTDFTDLKGPSPLEACGFFISLHHQHHRWHFPEACSTPKLIPWLPFSYDSSLPHPALCSWLPRCMLSSLVSRSQTPVSIPWSPPSWPPHSPFSHSQRGLPTNSRICSLLSWVFCQSAGPPIRGCEQEHWLWSRELFQRFTSGMPFKSTDLSRLGGPGTYFPVSNSIQDSFQHRFLCNLFQHALGDLNWVFYLVM